MARVDLTRGCRRWQAGGKRSCYVGEPVVPQAWHPELPTKITIRSLNRTSDLKIKNSIRNLRNRGYLSQSYRMEGIRLRWREW